MRHASRLPLSLVLLAALLGSPAAGQRRPPRQRSVITQEEIREANVGNAFDAVQQLRPRFLQARELIALPRTPGSTASAPLVYVYVNDVEMGGVDYLKNIPAELVEEIRYLDSIEAGNRFGASDGRVAIAVTLKRPPKPS